MQNINIKRIILVEATAFTMGTAATNRVIAYAKSYASLGKEVYLIGYSYDEISADLGQGVHPIIYVEDKTKFKLYRRLSIYWKIIKSIKKLYLKNESVVHIYGIPIWGFMLSRKKYNIFYERTEAFFYENGGLLFNIQEYLKLYNLKFAKGLFVISEALKREIQKRGVKHIEIINMFVDAVRFYGISNNSTEKYIAYCGVISVHKDGVNDLIKAFQLFREKYPSYKLLLIGGNHNIQEIEQVHQVVDDLNLSDSVIFTGRIIPEKIPSLLNNASILALARPNNKQSQYGFPTKLGEYLSSGNPVVVTKVGEIDHFLQDKNNCIFAKPDCPEDFADKLCWVASHPEEAKLIGERGRLLTENEFSALKQSERAVLFMQNIVNCEI